MLKEHRAHTTLPAADTARAKQWYQEKLGLSPVNEDRGNLVYEAANGTTFILYPTPNPTRGGHTQLGFTTQDIEADVAELKGRGVVFEEYDFPGMKTENGIASVDPIRAAWFKDSEDNMIGIIQLPGGAELVG
jgi:catechol 2,3-dioxygenase-like lactoylglutathione lyase family enzyme